MKKFPYQLEDYNGKEYISMKSDIFHSFFNEMVKYTDLDEELLKNINNSFARAKRITRKRRRHKKEKEILIVMYDILYDRFIMKKSNN